MRGWSLETVALKALKSLYVSGRSRREYWGWPQACEWEETSRDASANYQWIKHGSLSRYGGQDFLEENAGSSLRT